MLRQPDLGTALLIGIASGTYLLVARVRVAVLAGLALIIAPLRVRSIDQKMNTRYETRSWIERIQRPSHSLDTVLFRYPILSGLLGGSISRVLIGLWILNLLP